jgi:predicted MFS family arabinose efflux permease
VRWKSVLLAIAAGLALADASIVTLALPELLTDLHTTVEGVAAVIGVYTVVLCVALVPSWHLAQRVGYRGVGAGGFLLFALASVVCAQADDLTVLLIGRGLQAVGGAGALVAAFALLHAGDKPQRTLWLGAAVLSSALGPALGGALTQAFDWRAIFEAQVPLALIGVLAVLLEPVVAPEPKSAERTRPGVGPAAALAAVSAALTGVLFLLILLLVAGWNVEPLKAAAVVTALPIGALFGAQLRGGAPAVRAAAGCLLVGGGVLALAWLPDANVWWTVAPQLLAGVGMGLSLPALGGELLPERTAHDAAVLLTIRHAGIAVALALIAPIAANQLDSSIADAQQQGVAIVLDAKLPPQDKLRLAPDLLSSVEAQQPRTSLHEALDAQRGSYSGEQLAAYDELAARADDVLVTAVGSAFKPAFLIAGALALLGALFLVPRLRLAWLLAVAAVLAVVTPAAYALAHRDLAPEPVTIGDPCQPRKLPDSGGVSGFLQDQALKVLDQMACKNGSSREELVMALADDKAAAEYEKKYGVNPRSAGGLLQQGLSLLGLN